MYATKMEEGFIAFSQRMKMHHLFKKEKKCFYKNLGLFPQFSPETKQNTHKTSNKNKQTTNYKTPTNQHHHKLS